MLPKQVSTVAIVSTQGLINIVDVSNPKAISEFYQVLPIMFAAGIHH